VAGGGLLARLGSAPYSATKHAALAFAEWLAASYAHRGVTVQALCPMGVRTAMLDGTSPAAEIILGETAITAEEVADAVVAGIAAGGFLILPHPDGARMYAGRATDTDRWLRGMNRLQARVEAAGERGAPVRPACGTGRPWGRAPRSPPART